MYCSVGWSIVVRKDLNNPMRYPLLRRILFPYSGEDVLSFKQSMRVLLAWVVLIPLIISLCPLILATLYSYSFPRIAWLVLFAFLSGVFIFGSLGVLVVVTNNKLARIRQAKRVTGFSNIKASNTSGDMYGS
jgi:hypothetical protein